MREAPGTGLEDAILDRCASLRGVIVLDNCEHVDRRRRPLRPPPAGGGPHRCGCWRRAASRWAWPARCSSRWRHCPRRPRVSVRPLASRASDAVRLFADRATAVEPAFEINEENAVAVASLCRRLDGLPLAIELAAAQAYVLGPAQIDARLADRFGVLRSHDRTGLDRHRNMRALLDWSAARLDPVERTIFHRLSVFPASMSLERHRSRRHRRRHRRVRRRSRRSSTSFAARSSSPRAPAPSVATGCWRRCASTAESAWPTAGDLDRRRDRHRDWVLPWAVEAAEGSAQ